LQEIAQEVHCGAPGRGRHKGHREEDVVEVGRRLAVRVAAQQLAVSLDSGDLQESVSGETWSTDSL